MKDPEAQSLRGAPLRVTTESGVLAAEGTLGEAVDLWPGTYHLALPTLPGFERRVKVPGGCHTVLDLEIAHQITVEAEEGRAFGTPLRFWREDAPPEGDPLATGWVGVERLLPGGRFRVEVAGGATMILAAKRRKKRWPSVEPRFLGGDGGPASP